MYEDRDYYKEDEHGSAITHLRMMSMTMWLLVINVVIYFADKILFGSQRAHDWAPTVWGNFNYVEAVHGKQVWRFFTYQFLHSLTDFLHILFNMLVLSSVGPYLERWWGRWRFLAFYLLCGVSGSVIFTILCLIPGLLGHDARGDILVGASGSIYGILVGAAIVNPRQQMQILFLPFQFSLRTLSIILLSIAGLMILAGSAGAAGAAAHIGGAALGLTLVKFPFLLGFLPGGEFRFPRIPFLPKNDWASKQARLDKQREKEEAEVDRILDKVRAKGLHSLTRSEQKALQRATKRSAARDA